MEDLSFFFSIETEHRTSQLRKYYSLDIWNWGIFYSSRLFSHRSFRKNCKKRLKPGSASLHIHCRHMYSLHKDILPPSMGGIESCVEARFTSPTAVNLIVARSCYLQIYTVIEELHTLPSNHKSSNHSHDLVPSDTDNINIDLSKSSYNKLARLQLVGEYRLMGLITSLAVIRTTNSVGLLGMDSLLLSFNDAKVILLLVYTNSHAFAFYRCP